MNKALRAAFILVFALALPALAQIESAARQKALQYWKNLSPERRELVLKNYERYKGMSIAKRREIQERFAQFQALAPNKKSEIIKRWESFKSLPPQKQKEFRERLSAPHSPKLKEKDSGTNLRERKPVHRSEPRERLRFEPEGPRPHHHAGPRR